MCGLRQWPSVFSTFGAKPVCTFGLTPRDGSGSTEEDLFNPRGTHPDLTPALNGQPGMVLRWADEQRVINAKPLADQTLGKLPHERPSSSHRHFNPGG